MTPLTCRARLEFSRGALIANMRELARRVAPAEILAVVKANAYGVGTELVVPALLSAGVRRFGVATWAEAAELLHFGAEVRILSGIMPEEIAPAVAAGVVLPLIDLPTARAVAAEAARQGKVARGQLAIDSGMGRVGIPLADAPAAAAAIRQLKNLEVTGVYSHFPLAAPGDELSRRQIAGMARLAGELRLPQVHLAASEGAFYFPDAVRPPFNLVRFGLGMYGVMPDTGLRGCLTFKSRLAAVRDVPPGGTIGYGRLHSVTVPTRVGTVAAGYADGVPLALTNRGFFAVNGRLCPILGRVTMDYTMICLDDVPEAQVGDEVVLFTTGTPSPVDLNSWMNFKRTHCWELLCSISPRVARIGVE